MASSLLNWMLKEATLNPASIQSHSLSVDYLLNLGITLSDWITLKWAFEGQWNNDQLAIGFFLIIN